jgi:hypothetical protein
MYDFDSAISLSACVTLLDPISLHKVCVFTAMKIPVFFRVQLVSAFKGAPSRFSFTVYVVCSIRGHYKLCKRLHKFVGKIAHIICNHPVFIFFSCLPIPCVRVLREKLIITQLVKKFPHLLCKPKVHKKPSLYPIVSQMNPVHTLPY